MQEVVGSSPTATTIFNLSVPLIFQGHFKAGSNAVSLLERDGQFTDRPRKKHTWQAVMADLSKETLFAVEVVTIGRNGISERANFFCEINCPLVHLQFFKHETHNVSPLTNSALCYPRGPEGGRTFIVGSAVSQGGKGRR